MLMAAASTSETSVIFCQTTRRSNPEDGQLRVVLLFGMLNAVYQLYCTLFFPYSCFIGEHNVGFISS
jgi:hypothetical protein